jgi:putative tryptophan/tyrosine transport system permease protein
MSLLLGALIIGLILALVALGVFISFRVYHFPDMTAEGSITLGAAVAAALLVTGHSPVYATLAAAAAGAGAGLVTGMLHTRFKINALLSGIIVMTALYSVNLHVMGKSNVPLMNVATFADHAAAIAALFGPEKVLLFGREAAVRDLTLLGLSLALVVVVGGLLYAFFRTHLGLAMRATGDNDQMVRALGSSDGVLLTAGLALSNALVAMAGALLAQYQGFADAQMGIGMLVWGLASVIIGEALVGTSRFGYLLAGAVFGSILFRLLVAVALRWGLDPNDLKLITAVFVFGALVLPGSFSKLRRRIKAPVAGGSRA